METNYDYSIAKNGSDIETGLGIEGTFKSDTGLEFLAGVREFENLRIVEGVYKGTGNITLTSLMVFDLDGTLIYDAKIERQTSYSRELARRIVLKGLIAMLSEAAKRANSPFNSTKTQELLDEKLKLAYFERSYDAVLKWYDQIIKEIA